PVLSPRSALRTTGVIAAVKGGLSPRSAGPNAGADIFTAAASRRFETVMAEPESACAALFAVNVTLPSGLMVNDRVLAEDSPASGKPSGCPWSSKKLIDPAAVLERDGFV